MHRSTFAWSLVGLLALAACDSGPTEPRAAALTVQGGDAQSALVGQPLSQPLRVAVHTSGARPVEGAWVRWRITQGSGQLSADSARTDAGGIATVQLTLGTQPGPVLVAASVAQLAPVAFTATAQSHCQAGVVKTLRLYGGNGQSALTRDSLAAPLQVQALCDDATPLGGVAVAWRVTEGTATLYGATSQTDAAGLASARLAMPLAPGATAVLATAAGLDPVRFAATATDRCDPRAVVTADQALQTTLRDFDCARAPGIWGDSRYAVYRLEIAERQLVQLRMQILANGLDPVIELWDTAETRLLATGQGWFFASLEPGTYHVRTGTRVRPGGTPFVMSRQRLSAVPCSEVFEYEATPVWVARGATVQGTISPDDCGQWIGRDRWMDMYHVWMRAGESLAVTVRHGNGFSPAVGIGRGDNGDGIVGGGSYHYSDGSQVTATLTAARDGFHYVLIDGNGDNAVGPYTLELK